MAAELPEDACIEVPENAAELRDWLRELKDASGLSYAEIAYAIGEQDRNVKRWLAKDKPPVIPRGEVVLRLLSTLGVRLSPHQPSTLITGRELVEGLHAVAAATEQALGIENFLVFLQELEAKVETQGAATTESLESLERGIERILARLDAQDGRASTG